MKKTGITFICTILLMLGVACGDSSSTSTSTPTTSSKSDSKAKPNSANTLINKVLAPEAFKNFAANNEVTLLDIRTPKELKSTGYIKGAKNIDFYDGGFKDAMKSLDKSKPVMVYCASGGRSGKTAGMLKALKFKEVYDLDGGMGAWLEKNYAVEK